MEPSVTIRLENDRERFSPGEELCGSVSWSGFPEGASAELSVLWFTEGKGDRDSRVVHFQELALNQRGEASLQVILPLLPLTYHGQLIKIHWIIRVRIDKRWSRDKLYELPFEMRASESKPAALDAV